jgi:hypothetical protein
MAPGQSSIVAEKQLAEFREGTVGGKAMSEGGLADDD